MRIFAPSPALRALCLPLLTFAWGNLAAGAEPAVTDAAKTEAKAGNDNATQQVMDAAISKAWDRTWTRFYRTQTHLFYDYLSSYEPGKELEHLPTAEEVARQYPNPCGYSTGMEDGLILGGAMLSVLVDRHSVTGEEEMRSKIADVFQGVKLCLTVHGKPGFPARAISPKDGKNVYINSSRDQVTHAVHGLWRYYHSPLSDESRKEEIRILLRAVADLMIRNVTPENNYDFLRLDGTPCGLGICKMWEVQAHEAARLPMIYAAAWDVTGDAKYQEQYRRYLLPALDQSAKPDDHKPAYAFLQMQCSLEVLHDLEKDPALKQRIRSLMVHLGNVSMKRTRYVQGQLAGMTAEQKAMLGPDWRTVPEWKDQKGYMNPQWGPYRKVWHALREAGESTLVPLMVAEADIPAEQQQRLRDFLSQSDYDHFSSCGIVYHLASYWRARSTGKL